jgi:hypothetical protein
MSKRDEFLSTVKKTIAERAGYLCSVPNCNRPTIGPHSDPNKAKNLGVAAHICAAAEKGPRYDSRQTHTERTSIENAIWVCEMHGQEIDKDASPYSAEHLREWKRMHEEYMGTMINLGFRDALGLRSAVQGEHHLVEQLLIFLTDRHVLHSLYEFEVPRYCLESVQSIRVMLNGLRFKAREYQDLDTRFRAMQKACQKFVQEAGPLDSTELMFQPGSQIDYERIGTALSGLRNVFGLHIQQLSELYCLEIDEDLQTIVPRKLHASTNKGGELT